MTEGPSQLPAILLQKNGYLRQAQLIPHILPFSHATLWRMVKAGRFPAPVKLSDRITAWKSSAVIEWLEAKSNVGAA